jgi:hypothetical protein
MSSTKRKYLSGEEIASLLSVISPVVRKHKMQVSKDETEEKTTPQRKSSSPL